MKKKPAINSYLATVPNRRRHWVLWAQKRTFMTNASVVSGIAAARRARGLPTPLSEVYFGGRRSLAALLPPKGGGTPSVVGLWH